MKTNVTEQDGVAIITISGKMVGGPDTGELDEKLYALLGRGVKLAVIDLTRCEWINSSGLSILIFHYKKFRDVGGELALASLDGKVYRIMIISRLTEVFRVFNSVAGAMKGLLTPVAALPT